MGLEETLSLAGTQATVPAVQLLQVLFGLASSLLNNGSEECPPSEDVCDGQTFDFIVVGAGSAGCVMASRLSEIGNWSVLLIEAGGDPPIISGPPALVDFMSSSEADWGYDSVNNSYSSQAHKGGTVHCTRGKFLGGSSGLNYMLYVRGNKADYGAWKARGNKGWDWDTVTKYFKKIESFKDYDILMSDSGPLHSTDGNVHVTRPNWDEYTKEYFAAYKENGRVILEDTNGYEQLGYSSPQMNIYNGVRQSSYVAYIKPIENRPNLFILKNTFARRVILDCDNTAIGVEAKLSDGSIVELFVNKEVIVSAGGINSPIILMNSGIGPRDHLEEMGIDVIVENSQVGQNAQDHQFVVLPTTGKENPSSAVQNINLVTKIHEFPPTILAYQALNKTQTYPDYQMIAFPLPAASVFASIFCSHVVKLEDSICAKLVQAGLRKEMLLSTVHIMHAKSKGQIRLRSDNPEDKPLIHTNYFDNHTDDLDTFASCVEDYLTVLDTSYFRSIKAEVVDLGIPQCTHLTFSTREYWKCFILNTVSSEYHIAGTCAMAPDGVVDEKLRVHGTKGLRVVDISVMPELTSGATNAPTMMIAENAADMIKSEYGYQRNQIF